MQRCLSSRADGWQVRWREPVSDGFVPTTLFFSRARYGAAAERAAHDFAEAVRVRLFGAQSADTAPSTDELPPSAPSSGS